MCSMFLENQGAKITTDAVLEAVANPHDRRILAVAQGEPVDAQAIIETTGISKSTVYRRIEKLSEQGLLETADGRLRNGHAIDRYRACVQNLTVTVQDGEIKAQWQPRNAPEPEQKAKPSQGPPNALFASTAFAARS